MTLPWSEQTPLGLVVGPPGFTGRQTFGANPAGTGATSSTFWQPPLDHRDEHSAQGPDDGVDWSKVLEEINETPASGAKQPNTLDALRIVAGQTFLPPSKSTTMDQQRPLQPPPGLGQNFPMQTPPGAMQVPGLPPMPGQLMPSAAPFFPAQRNMSGVGGPLLPGANAGQSLQLPGMPGGPVPQLAQGLPHGAFGQGQLPGVPQQGGLSAPEAAAVLGVIQELNRRLGLAKQEAAAATAAVEKEYQARLVAVEAERDGQRDRADGADKQLAVMKDELVAAKAQAVESMSAVTSLRDKLTASEKKAKCLSDEKSEWERKAKAAFEARDTAVKEQKEAAKATAEQAKTVSELQAAVAQARDELARANASARSAREEAAGAKAELAKVAAEARKSAEASKAALAAAAEKEKGNSLKAVVDKLSKHVETLAGEVKSREAEVARLNTVVDQATSSLALMNQGLAKVQKERDGLKAELGNAESLLAEARKSSTVAKDAEATARSAMQGWRHKFVKVGQELTRTREQHARDKAAWEVIFEAMRRSLVGEMEAHDATVRRALEGQMVLEGGTEMDADAQAQFLLQIQGGLAGTSAASAAGQAPMAAAPPAVPSTGSTGGASSSQPGPHSMSGSSGASAEGGKDDGVAVLLRQRAAAFKASGGRAGKTSTVAGPAGATAKPGGASAANGATTATAGFASSSGEGTDASSQTADGSSASTDPLDELREQAVSQALQLLAASRDMLTDRSATGREVLAKLGMSLEAGESGSSSSSSSSSSNTGGQAGGAEVPSWLRLDPDDSVPGPGSAGPGTGPAGALPRAALLSPSVTDSDDRRISDVLNSLAGVSLSSAGSAGSPPTDADLAPLELPVPTAGPAASGTATAPGTTSAASAAESGPVSSKPTVTTAGSGESTALVTTSSHSSGSISPSSASTAVTTLSTKKSGASTALTTGTGAGVGTGSMSAGAVGDKEDAYFDDPLRVPFVSITYIQADDDACLKRLQSIVKLGCPVDVNRDLKTLLYCVASGKMRCVAFLIDQGVRHADTDSAMRVAALAVRYAVESWTNIDSKKAREEMAWRQQAGCALIAKGCPLLIEDGRRRTAAGPGAGVLGEPPSPGDRNNDAVYRYDPERSKFGEGDLFAPVPVILGIKDFAVDWREAAAHASAQTAIVPASSSSAGGSGSSHLPTGSRRFTTFKVAAKQRVVAEIWAAWSKEWDRVASSGLASAHSQGQLQLTAGPATASSPTAGASAGAH